jgi:hypothetical protein
MEELEGEGFKELLIRKLKELQEWLKPNPNDTMLVTSLKMVYKLVAVLILIAFSPVILIVMVFVFFAVF